MSKDNTDNFGNSNSNINIGETILDIENFSKWFPIHNSWNRQTGWLKALDKVSLTVK